MTDHPILFSAPMIRALLREIDAPGMGKTQTRRIIKPQPIDNETGGWSWEGRNGGFVGAAGTHVDEGFPQSAAAWSRIQPGDRLWVREAWRTHAHYDDLSPSRMGGEEPVQYQADRAHQTWGYPSISKIGRARPSMHMPRWASRLTLYVTEVRVQRLQEISEADAIAEGILHQNVILDVKCYGGQPIEITADRHWNGTEPDEFEGFESASEAYADLWDQINGPGAWDANPWVVAYTFTPRLGNIDTLPATLQEAA